MKVFNPTKESITFFLIFIEFLVEKCYVCLGMYRCVCVRVWFN